MMKVVAFMATLFLSTPAFSYDLTARDSEAIVPQLEQMQQELDRYHAIQQKGGWKPIKATKKFYQKDESAPAVSQIKARLRASGEFKSDDDSPQFTAELVTAVKKAQRLFGFKENGVVDGALIKELNRPVEYRIGQLQLNMERLRALPPATGGTRLIANIPEFKLHVYEGDRHVFDMDIVVGTEANKTVTFNDEMKQVVFSPYWNVPPSIVKNEILPAMRRSRDYLWRNGYVQTGTENGLPVIRQLPGSKNALGGVKFLFPNSHNIYFHDTPAKSLFQARRRAFSHGCIRLAEPAKLAQYLLRDVPGWTPDKISKAMNAGKEQSVALPSAVPVSITYFTAWVDKAGQLHFREDIYGHDKGAAASTASSARR
jgi:murein L,D-transpeptidase YcbB/YkuD